MSLLFGAALSDCAEESDESASEVVDDDNVSVNWSKNELKVPGNVLSIPGNVLPNTDKITDIIS